MYLYSSVYGISGFYGDIPWLFLIRAQNLLEIWVCSNIKRIKKNRKECIRIFLIIKDNFALIGVGNDPDVIAPTIPENLYMIYQW